MILWKEYQRIKEKGEGWDDNDMRIMLNFCWELQITQYEISEELKTALDQLSKMRHRVEFYRQLYPLREVKNAPNKRN
jgi:hypothetical protein